MKKSRFTEELMVRLLKGLGRREGRRNVLKARPQRAHLLRGKSKCAGLEAVITQYQIPCSGWNDHRTGRAGR